MPLQATSGAASYDGFGGGVPFTPTYIEDVFSTFLYTGNGANRSINNGIDLSTKGGLVWIKDRTAVASNALYDTARGANNLLISNNTNAQNAQTDALTAFNTNGFSLGVDSSTLVNASGDNFVSWTFRKQPKFFDVVTYTGNGATSRNISHSLGAAPGFIVIKRTSGISDWLAYHRSLGTGNKIFLNDTLGSSADADAFATVTSTTFSVSTGTAFNDNGATYVAYLFAHNAGGFGLTGTDNVISCGSVAAGTTNQTITLGYEPQFVLFKKSSAVGNWLMADTMRGIVTESNGLGIERTLQANTSAAEDSTGTGFFSINATGMRWETQDSSTYIYIAIRRGPMRTPTTGTSVFQQLTGPALGSSSISVGLPYSYSGPDLLLSKTRESTTQSAFVDRLRGAIPAANTTNVPVLRAESTAAEVSATSNAYRTISGSTQYLEVAGTTTQSAVGYFFRRAPSFFDVVCYTGNATARTLNHNLGVVPEMMIGKSRSGTFDWCVYHKDVGNTKAIYLNGTGTPVTSLDFWNDTTPTASVFTIGTINRLNTNNATQVMYLFASCPGVSKVGSYTGTGALQTINCGFTGGARFVLIKRTDSTGGWFTYDSARGITSGNDPYLLMNSAVAEVTGTNYVDTTSVGFQVTAAAPAGLNANGGTYIYLAIA